MTGTFELIHILNNGRKGERGTPVTGSKYDYMVGCQVHMDLTNLKQYRPFRWDFKNHLFYEWWNTSDVIEVMYGKNTGNIHIETANTIYVFRPVDNQAITAIKEFSDGLKKD